MYIKIIHVLWLPRNLRTIEPSDYRTFGLSNLRTIEPSDYRYVTQNHLSHAGTTRYLILLIIINGAQNQDRKSTRLNSSHSQISYAVFCLKKKKNKQQTQTYHSK